MAALVLRVAIFIYIRLNFSNIIFIMLAYWFNLRKFAK